MAENFGPYSNLKFIHHADRVKSINGSIPAPVNVQLVLSNACNLNCSFCYYRNANFPPAQAGFDSVRNAIMPTHKVRELIADCAAMGVKSITLTGGGEPSVHPDFEAICGQVIKAGLDLGLNTNGVNLSPAFFELIRFPEFQWVKLSLDALSLKTYRNIKKGKEDSWAKAWFSIRAFVAAKRRYQSEMTVGVGMIVVPENYQEILALAEELKRVGVDSFRIRSVAGTILRDFYGDKAQEIAEICRESQMLTDSKFKVENLFADDIKTERHPLAFYSPACSWSHPPRTRP